MIRILVVADSGSAMAEVTGTLCSIVGADIAGYASGRAPVGPVALAVQPDVAVVDQMGWSGLALNRIRELRDACPGTAIVGLSDPDGDWAADGLDAGADTVVSRDLAPATLALVLHDAITDRCLPSFELSAA